MASEKRTIIYTDIETHQMIEQRRKELEQSQKATVEAVMRDILDGRYDELLERKAPREKRFSVNKKLSDQLRQKVRKWNYNMPQALHVVLRHQLSQQQEQEGE